MAETGIKVEAEPKSVTVRLDRTPLDFLWTPSHLEDAEYTGYPRARSDAIISI